MDYGADTKTARMQAVADMIDAASGPGKVVLGTTGMATVLVEIPLADPCGTVSGDTLTLDLDPVVEAEAVAVGTIAAAVITDGDGNVVCGAMSAGTSGTDVVVDNVAVAVGQIVRVTVGTITHA